MPKADTGTRAWFDETRLDLLESARATHALYMADNSITSLTSNWSELDRAIAFALTTTCIACYARPFVDRHSTGGKRRYKLSRIAGFPGFDVALHRHLIQLRHKAVSHSDEDFLDAKIHVQAAMISTGERSVKLVAEVGVRSTALWVIRERETAQSWASHVRAALTAAAKDTSKLLEMYFEQARLFPDACPLLDVQDAEEISRFKVTLEPGETFSVPLGEMPLTPLKTPPNAKEHSIYLFQLLTMATRGPGSTVTDLGDGFSIDHSTSAGPKPT